MVASPTDAKSGNSSNFLLWTALSLAELLVIIVVYTHRGDSPALGTPVTQILAVFAMLATLFGAAVEWREMTGQIRLAAAVTTFVGAVAALIVGVSFVTAGLLAVWSPLMLHTAVMMVIIGRGLLRPATVISVS